MLSARYLKITYKKKGSSGIKLERKSLLLDGQ